MNIKVLGGGCSKCEALLANTKKAAAERGVDAEIEYITDSSAIAGDGSMRTPALMIDGTVLSSGRVLNEKQIGKLLGH